MTNKLAPTGVLDTLQLTMTFNDVTLHEHEAAPTIINNRWHVPFLACLFDCLLFRILTSGFNIEFSDPLISVFVKKYFFSCFSKCHVVN